MQAAIGDNSDVVSGRRSWQVRWAAGAARAACAAAPGASSSRVVAALSAAQPQLPKNPLNTFMPHIHALAATAAGCGCEWRRRACLEE